jgi:hypothetical protein
MSANGKIIYDLGSQQELGDAGNRNMSFARQAQDATVTAGKTKAAGLGDGNAGADQLANVMSHQYKRHTLLGDNAAKMVSSHNESQHIMQSTANRAMSQFGGRH